MLVPLNLTGGNYQEKARELTNQFTRNFWPKPIASEKAVSRYILQCFYGLRKWTNHPGFNCRGMRINQGKLYKVTDTTLYEVSKDGTHTELGFIPGSNRCIISPLGDQLVIANGGGRIYVYDGETVTQNTSINLGSPKGVAVLNSQAIYDRGSGQIFDVSDVGKPSIIDGLNFAAAESYSDELLLPYAYREMLYLFGAETIELWWNSGIGNPPFDRVQGSIINLGLNAIYSVADSPDFIFFLGSDKQFHTLTAGSSSVDTVISPPALTALIEKYSVTKDCIGWTMELEGQWFYVATFPTQDITWVYPVGGEWFEWGTGKSGRIRANSYVNIFDKHLVGDVDSGSIYELDSETYTDMDETIVRVRDTAPIHGGLFQQDGKTFEISELQLFLETGVGLLEGQGSDPHIIISISRDGKTFGTERFIKVGELGKRTKVVVKNLGRFDYCVIRVQVSDPIFWAIFSAKAEMEFCI